MEAFTPEKVGLTIEEVALRIGLSKHTLRYYERIGLLDPIARAPSGHRLYSPGDLAWLEFLTRLRVTGMPIRRMQEFAALRRRGDSTISQRRALLEAHQKQLEARLQELERHLGAIKEKIHHYQILEVNHDPNE